LQHHPWPFAIGGFLVLILLAVPVLSIRLGSSDASNLPTSSTTRRAYDIKAAAYGPGASGPLVVVAELPAGSTADAVAPIAAQVAATPGVAFVSPPRLDAAGDAAQFIVTPTTSSQDAATTDLTRHLRNTVLPQATAGTGITAHVGGITALFDDLATQLQTRLPIFIGVVLLLSFLLLMLVFRSIVVPLKAVIMNLLSIGAAYGVIVAIFQNGWMKNLIGIGKEGPIEAWVPMMLFAIIFGLSMDYEVFLLSRIKEEYDRDHDNATAVSHGLAKTARLITAAAAIMICVFGSFVLSDMRVLKLIGFGLAFAVFIDATVVRLVLVPATMELLGDKNWWFPKWLEWLPQIQVEGAQLPEPEPAPEREPEPALGD
jgi:RND superfamily putative drug exporter